MTMAWLERYDLTPIFIFASVVGVLLCIIVAIDIANKVTAAQDPPLVRWIRRVGLFAISYSLLDSLIFSGDKVWQPWPGHVATVVGIDIWLTALVLSGARRRSASPSQSDIVCRKGWTA